MKNSFSPFRHLLLSSFIAVFPNIYNITVALLKSEIDGAFIDSFIITAHLDLIKDHPGLRVERTIEHPVTYGMVLAGNSSQMANCARRYVENYPRRVFQKIAHHLKPLKVRHNNNDDDDDDDDYDDDKHLFIKDD